MARQLKHINPWLGVFAAVPLACYGLVCVITQRAILVGEGYGGPWGLLHFRGHEAVAMGVVYLGIALALHSSFVWGRLEATWRLSILGVVLGLVAALPAFAYVLWRFAIRFGNFPVS